MTDRDELVQALAGGSQALSAVRRAGLVSPLGGRPPQEADRVLAAMMGEVT